MGYDLKPMRANKRYPRGEDGKPVWGRYNIYGWFNLRQSLEALAFEYELPDHNGGVRVPAKICKEIADLIESNPDAFAWMDKDYQLDSVSWWRNCGGYRVW